MAAHTSPAHIILEPNPTGHRFSYVEMLLRAARAAKHPIMLVTTQHAAYSAEYATHLEQLVNPHDLTLIEDGNERRAIGRIRIRNRLLRHAHRLCDEYPDAQLVIPELSHFLMPWALRRDRKQLAHRATALLTRPEPEPATALRFLIRRRYSVRQTAAALVRGLILKRLRAHGLTVFDLVPAFGEASGRNGEAPRRWAAVDGHLRDPAAALVAGSPCSRAESRVALGLPADEALVLVTGSIDRRKGFDLILASCELLNRRKGCPLLVVAGVVEPELLQDPRLHGLQAAHWLWMRNEYLTPSDYRAFLCSADVVLIIRPPDENLSGVLAQAAVCGRIVVTVGPSVMADTVVRHELGVVAATAPEALARAIEQAIADQERLEEALITAQKTQLDVGDQFTSALLRRSAFQAR